MLNISNIPALTDIKSNFHIYGKARVLEDDKIGNYRGEDNQKEPIINSTASGLKMFNITEMDKEKEEGNR